MEVRLISKVRRLRRQCSPPPWQSYIPSGSVLVHVSFFHELWMDISGDVANIHMRTDAKNLVITARTIHLPEHKETIHNISMLRKTPVQEVFMILLTFQPNLLGRLPHKGRSQSGQSDHNCGDSCLTLTFTLILETLWSTRPSCHPGVKYLRTQGRRKCSS